MADTYSPPLPSGRSVLDDFEYLRRLNGEFKNPQTRQAAMARLLKDVGGTEQGLADACCALIASMNGDCDRVDGDSGGSSEKAFGAAATKDKYDDGMRAEVARLLGWLGDSQPKFAPILETLCGDKVRQMLFRFIEEEETAKFGEGSSSGNIIALKSSVMFAIAFLARFSAPFAVRIEETYGEPTVKLIAEMLTVGEDDEMKRHGVVGICNLALHCNNFAVRLDLPPYGTKIRHRLAEMLVAQSSLELKRDVALALSNVAVGCESFLVHLDSEHRGRIQPGLYGLLNQTTHLEACFRAAGAISTLTCICDRSFSLSFNQLYGTQVFARLAVLLKSPAPNLRHLLFMAMNITYNDPSFAIPLLTLPEFKQFVSYVPTSQEALAISILAHFFPSFAVELNDGIIRPTFSFSTPKVGPRARHRLVVLLTDKVPFVKSYAARAIATMCTGAPMFAIQLHKSYGLALMASLLNVLHYGSFEGLEVRCFNNNVFRRRGCQSIHLPSGRTIPVIENVDDIAKADAAVAICNLASYCPAFAVGFNRGVGPPEGFGYHLRNGLASLLASSDAETRAYAACAITSIAKNSQEFGTAMNTEHGEAVSTRLEELGAIRDPFFTNVAKTTLETLRRPNTLSFMKMEFSDRNAHYDERLRAAMGAAGGADMSVQIVSGLFQAAGSISV